MSQEHLTGLCKGGHHAQCTGQMHQMSGGGPCACPCHAEQHRAACCGELYTGPMEQFYDRHVCPNYVERGGNQLEETGETGMDCRMPDPQGWS